MKKRPLNKFTASILPQMEIQQICVELFKYNFKFFLISTVKRSQSGNMNQKSW